MENAYDFQFTDQHFEDFRKMVFEHTGIALSDCKKEMVRGRLTRRLRKLELGGFDDYVDYILENPAQEMGNFINAVTTNLTSFFREKHHFDYLGHTLLPDLIKEKHQSHKLRIWSAGCSTGEEPYSIAMTLREHIPNIDAWDIRILATDIDTNVLAKGREGIYEENKITDLDRSRVKRWFIRGRNGNADCVQVKSELQEMIVFKRLNLMEVWPIKGTFNILFCRNVVIYFDKPTQRILFERFCKQLTPNAHMFIGHSESLFKITDRFQLLGNTIYRRIK